MCRIALLGLLLLMVFALGFKQHNLKEDEDPYKGKNPQTHYGGRNE